MIYFCSIYFLNCLFYIYNQQKCGYFIILLSGLGKCNYKCFILLATKKTFGTLYFRDFMLYFELYVFEPHFLSLTLTFLSLTLLNFMFSSLILIFLSFVLMFLSFIFLRFAIIFSNFILSNLVFLNYFLDLAFLGLILLTFYIFSILILLY